MIGVERRSQERLIMRLPIRVRGIWQEPHEERTVDSLNISLQGTYFASEEKFRVGEKINIWLKMPEVVIAGQRTEWRFTARITHVDKLGTDGKNGVGVFFLSYTSRAVTSYC